MKKTIIAFAVLGILLLASIGAYASSISDKQAQAWEQALKGESPADLPESISQVTYGTWNGQYGTVRW